MLRLASDLARVGVTVRLDILTGTKAMDFNKSSYAAGAGDDSTLTAREVKELAAKKAGSPEGDSFFLSFFPSLFFFTSLFSVFILVRARGHMLTLSFRSDPGSCCGNGFPPEHAMVMGCDLRQPTDYMKTFPTSAVSFLFYFSFCFYVCCLGSFFPSFLRRTQQCDL